MKACSAELSAFAVLLAVQLDMPERLLLLLLLCCCCCCVAACPGQVAKASTYGLPVKTPTGQVVFQPTKKLQLAAAKVQVEGVTVTDALQEEEQQQQLGKAAAKEAAAAAAAEKQAAAAAEQQRAAKAAEEAAAAAREQGGQCSNTLRCCLFLSLIFILICLLFTCLSSVGFLFVCFDMSILLLFFCAAADVDSCSRFVPSGSVTAAAAQQSQSV